MNLYGLIGYPLSHSFSEQYFTEKFSREHLVDCIFNAFPIESINDFPALLKDNPSLKGLSITIPYKEQVLPFITSLSEEVKIIGATNSIKISGKSLHAYNTDIFGFKKSFLEFLQPHHTKALVLGTGGASKAVQFVLQKLNIKYLVVSRNIDLEKGFINYASLDQRIIEEHQVIINCTPSGMWPRIDECPAIPYFFITPNHYAYDLVYKPEKTLFLSLAEQQGATIKNGFDMLILQAEESWRLWNE